jgi:hypothetical protein
MLIFVNPENDKPLSGIEDSVTTPSKDGLPHADLDGATIVHRDKDDISVAYLFPKSQVNDWFLLKHPSSSPEKRLTHTFQQGKVSPQSHLVCLGNKGSVNLQPTNLHWNTLGISSHEH